MSSNAPLYIGSHKKTNSCRVLCDLNLQYTNVIPSYNSTKGIFNVTRKDRTKEYDVIFRKYEYRLLWFLVSHHAHTSLHESDAEMTLVHENIEDPSDRLVISYPLHVLYEEDINNKYTSQNDAFRQLNELVVSGENVSTTWNIERIFPDKRSFYLYKGGYPFYESGGDKYPDNSDDYTYTNVAFDKPATIPSSDFDSIKTTKMVAFPEINDDSIPVYYNDGELKAPKKKVDEKDIELNSYHGFQRPPDSILAPHINNDEPPEEYMDIGMRVQQFLVSVIGICIILWMFFSGNEYSSICIKFIGVVIWAMSHFAYIAYGWIIAWFYFAVIWLIVTLSLLFYRFVLYIWRLIFGEDKTQSNSGPFTQSLRESMKNGIYNQWGSHIGSTIFKVIVLLHAVPSLYEYFIRLYGPPMSFASSSSIYKDRTYSIGNKLCRNAIYRVGNGTPINECYGEIDLGKYISNPETRKAFKAEYEKLKRGGASAHNAFLGASAEIVPDSKEDENYDVGGDVIEICDMYNTMFHKQFQRKCTRKSIDEE